MKGKALILILILSGIAAVSRCKPDKDPEPPKTVAATPYEFEVPPGFPQPLIPSDNPLTVEGIRLGRHLFYDKRLSADLSMSCSSCHHQNYYFQDTAGKQFSVGITGQQGRRQAMPLFNLAWQEFFFWDGRAASLEEQVLHPIRDPIELATDVPTVLARLQADTLYPEMFKKAYGDDQITQERFAKALAQFLRIIVSSDSKFDKVVRLNNQGGVSFTELEQKGYELFVDNNGADCFHCHGAIETGYLFSAFGQDDQFKNNGLDENFPAGTDMGRYEVTGLETDIGKFKVPSLRNLIFTAPYMHDGRFQTMDDVISFYDHEVHKYSPNLDPNMNFPKESGGLQLTQPERNQLIAFLNTLNDYTFLEDTAYSNPWLKN